MDKVLKVSGDGRLRVKLIHDEDCESPRSSQDNIAYVITLPHREFGPVDKDAGPLAEGWDEAQYRWLDPRANFIRWARAFHGAVILDDRPNQGADALWYILPDRFGEVPNPLSALEEERDEYRKWAEGECFGYVIQESVKYVEVGGDRERQEWETTESCFGYIGYEYAKATALEEFDNANGGA